MQILLIPNLDKPQAAALCAEAGALLQTAGAQPLLFADWRQRCPVAGALYLAPEEAYARCFAIVTIGGDGTILRAARESLAYDKPLLGVNLGRMGFLATCEVAEMPDKLARLCRGDFLPDRRMLLQARVEEPERPPITLTALNDVVLFKGLRTHTIQMEVLCDEAPVSSYRGDGVVLATPTGSTAYSLSAGGPILDSAISGIVLTPICAHSLQSPPMVFSASRRLQVQVESESEEPVYLSADGAQPALAVSPRSRLEMSCAHQTVTLVRFNPADQFEAIDKKLKGR